MTVDKNTKFGNLPVIARLSNRVFHRREQYRDATCEIQIEPIQKRYKESVRKQYARIGGSVAFQHYNHPLLLAVETQDYGSCKKLLDEGADVNFRDNGTGLSPLHISAKHENPIILKLLLENGANCNAQDDNEQTPIHYAVRKDHIRNLGVLLEHDGLNINIPNRSHDTPLHVIAKEGRIEMCKLALQHKNIHINAKNKKGMTPLHVASQENHHGVLQLLLDNGSDWSLRDHNSYLPLHYSASKGYAEVCEILINYNNGANKEKQLKACIKDGKTPLMLAAKQGHRRCCVLMEYQNINAKDREGNTALHYATKNAFEGTVAALLEMGANPDIKNKKGMTPVHEAAMKKKDCCLQSLFNKGADLCILDCSGKSVCHYASDRNASDSLEFLLKNAAVAELIDVKDNSGNTSLHVAIKRDAVQCATLLLEGGASPTIECAGGMTPLHLAAGQGYTGLCEAPLSKREVDVNQENEQKATPLHLAALQGSADVIQMLIRKGARVSITDAKDRTPLHIAASQGFANAVKILCKKGVSLRAKDDSGSCALHLAASKGSLECCKILVVQSKTTCWELDGSKMLPLDRSFKNLDGNKKQTDMAQHDLVFQFLLKNMCYNEKNEELILRIHSYMDKAILQKRKIIIEAIVGSSWWYAGISGENTHQCDNFHHLIANYPELALKIMDLCITRPEESGSLVTYDFRLLEDDYFIPPDTKGATISVFHHETQSVLPEAVAYTEDSLKWKRHHPVTHMISHHRLEMLLHPLTKKWLLQKFSTYLQLLILALLILELCLTATLTFYMGFIENWLHVKTRCNSTNFTVEKFCQNSSSLDICDITDVKRDAWHSSEDRKFGFWIALIVLSGIISAKELYFMWRLGIREYLTYKDHFLRLVRMAFIILVLIFTGCGFDYMILETWNWQCGIIALLLTWLHTINSLNQIPMLSTFMPVTSRFMKSFFKVLLYMLLIVFIFAFIFHLLLSNQEAFATLDDAMVKTMAWILQDLAYDNTFVLNDAAPRYPGLIKILFIVFVAFLGGFIVNFIITLPSNQLDLFREKACFHRAALIAEMFFKMDICFPFFRRAMARGKLTEDENMKNHVTSFMKDLLGLDSQEETNPPSQSEILQKEIEKHNEQITNLLAVNTKQLEELSDLKCQVNMLTKALIK